MNIPIRKQWEGPSWSVGATAWLLIVLMLSLLMMGHARAATPAAGSVIGNQASATYTDASSQTKSATSNLVQTTVLQVGSFTLVQDNTKTAAVGNTVYMPHTLTNTGNGNDTFKLSLTDNAGSFDATNLAIYLDANGDGMPDSTTPVCSGVAACTNWTTPGLPAGGTFKFVVSMTVPGTATASQSDSVTVTATAGTPSYYTTTSQSNTDSLTVTGAAAFQVVKSISATQGPAGVTLTYTLTYTNVGAAAGTLALSDVIGSGSTVGYTYQANSAVWSAGATTLTDAYTVGVPDATVGGMEIHYKAATSSGVTTIQADVTNVGPNVTGSISFAVAVKSTAAVGTSETTNAALYGVDTDTDPTNNTLTQSSNTSSYNVLASYSLVLNDGTGSPTDGSNTRPASTDTDSVANADLKYTASASPGETIPFDNYVWNTGNTSDTFNVTVTALGTWPTGTTFQLFKYDGSTPLLDTNGDGIPDTGSVAAGASYKVFVKVTLPANACAGGCPTGPFDVEVVASSVGDPTKTNKTYDRLGAIAAPLVDIANSTINKNPGDNADAIGASPTTTKTVLPGQTAVFDLYVRNQGSISDSYSIAYSATNAFSPATALPSGWTLQFRTTGPGGCAAGGGSVITSLGPLAAGAESHICAVVTVPTGALAGTTSVYFQVLSQVTGAVDAKWDAVTVQAVNSLTLAPSNTGQIYPGSTVVYAHTLSNTGNTSCAAPFSITINQSLAAQGWTYVVYRDVNGDGQIDSGDTVLGSSLSSPATLAPGDQVKLLVKVFAPAGAAPAASDVVSLSMAGTCNGSVATATNTVTDTTTVVTGQVRLVKTQALDAACDGTADAAFSANALSGKPGECLIYTVVATNEGLGNVTALTISDTLPAYTTVTGVTYAPNPTCSTGTAAYTAPTFTCSGITLTPAGSVTMTFSVKVQQ